MRSFIFFILTTLLLMSLHINSVNAFDDIDHEYSWAKDAISALTTLGSVSGTDSDHFSPEKTLTRAELSKMLALTFGAKLSTPKQATFADVLPSHWAFPYVEACKDIFTGIQNPVGEKPLFLPDALVTREDFACFLILADGLAPESNSLTVLNRFSDVSSVSPHLKPYVSKAIRKEYLLGFSDRTIRPLKPVTRAEAVIMLFRAFKKGGDMLQKSISLQAEVTKGKSTGQYIFEITCEEVQSLTLDSKPIQLKEKAENRWVGTQTVQLDEENTYTFQLTAKKGFRTVTLQKEIDYNILPPILVLTDIPLTSHSRTLRIRGNVRDEYDPNPKVWINSRNASFGFNGDWSYLLSIQEGENEVSIKAANRFGKTVEQTYVITGTPSVPSIAWTNCPENTDIQFITLSGNIQSQDSNVSLFINQTPCTLKSDNSFSHKVKLKNGENRILVRAVNSFGRECTQQLRIYYKESS